MRKLKTAAVPPNVFKAPSVEQEQTMNTSEMMGAFVFELMNGIKPLIRKIYLHCLQYQLVHALFDS